MKTKKTRNKIILCLIINIILYLILYKLNTDNDFFNHLCIYRLVTGKKCFNCGMTRAFIAVLQGNILKAIYYNKNVIIVFPYTLIIYAYFWLKYILGGKRNE